MAPVNSHAAAAAPLALADVSPRQVSDPKNGD